MIVYSKVIVQPEAEPVTVAEAKQHLRVDGSDEDTYIEMLIKVARQMCEVYSGLSFLTQQREIKLDSFPCGNISLPYGPVQSIDDFVYFDGDDSSQTMTDGTDYTKDFNYQPARIQRINSWPTVYNKMSSVVISYTAGYANDDHDPLPDVIKSAILLQVGTLYENRQNDIVGATVNAVNSNSEFLLDTIKVYYSAEA